VRITRRIRLVVVVTDSMKWNEEATKKLIKALEDLELKTLSKKISLDLPREDNKKNTPGGDADDGLDEME